MPVRRNDETAPAKADPVGPSGCGAGTYDHRVPPAPPLLLRPLVRDDEEQALAAEHELAGEGFDFLVGREGRPFGWYVDRCEANRQGRDLPPGHVPATFLVGVVDGDLVGRVSVRHRLDEHLTRVGGHIGYGVRPAYRRRGYATAMLVEALVVARGLGIEAALVTCADTNAASAGVVERCGGVLQDVVEHDGSRVRRYLVPTAGRVPSQPSGPAAA